MSFKSFQNMNKWFKNNLNTNLKLSLRKISSVRKYWKLKPIKSLDNNKVYWSKALGETFSFYIHYFLIDSMIHLLGETFSFYIHFFLIDPMIPLVRRIAYWRHETQSKNWSSFTQRRQNSGLTRGSKIKVSFFCISNRFIRPVTSQ